MNRSVLRSTVRFTWAAIVLVVIASLAIAITADRPALTNADRVRQLTEDFACPVCAGQSLADSDAAVARTIRATISTLVDKGTDDNEVRSLLVARFGTDIEYNPSGSGVISLVWIGACVAYALSNWPHMPLDISHGDDMNWRSYITALAFILVRCGLNLSRDRIAHWIGAVTQVAIQ